MTFQSGCVSYSSYYLRTAFHGSILASLWASEAFNLANLVVINFHSVFPVSDDFGSAILVTSIVTGYLPGSPEHLIKVFKSVGIVSYRSVVNQHTTDGGK